MIGWGAGVLTALLLSPQGVPPHRPLSPEELARDAAVVGVASVVRSEVRRDPDHGGLFTDYRLRFHEVWKGVPGADFVLTQYGGSLDGRSAAIPGWTYVLKPAEKFVLFAAPFKGRHTVIGMRQGLYRIPAADPSRVVKDTESPAALRPHSETSLENLKRRVFAATGRELPGAEEPPAVPAEPGPEPGEPPVEAVPEPRSAPPAAPPADPGRSAGLLLAFLLLAATATIGWTQWRRKTETGS